MSQPDYFVHLGLFVEEGCSIGADTKIWHFCHKMTDSTNGSNSNLGKDGIVSPKGKPLTATRHKSYFNSTIVKRGATIGANATIVCGNTIGEFALIGAGTVVTKDLPLMR